MKYLMIVMAVAVMAAGCTFLAEKLPPAVSKPVLEAGETAAGVGEAAASTGAQTATEIAAKAEDPATKVAGWLAALVLTGAANMMRKAKKSAQDALAIVTEKVETKGGKDVQDAIASAALMAPQGVKDAIEKARPARLIGPAPGK